MSGVTAFPTGKNTVSYSEIADWLACSWRHKLKHVDKIDVSRPSPHMAFGRALHKACESYLQTRTVDRDLVVAELEKEWDADAYGPIGSWIESARAIVADLPARIDAEFPGWKLVSVEDRLCESMERHDGMSFKGFVDAVLSVPGPRGQELLWVIDFKTSTRGWFREKRSDESTLLQLRLYKRFLSKKMGVDVDRMRCAFVILKRNARAGDHCEVFRVSVGPETSARALRVVDNMVAAVKRGIAIKNRESCRYCDHRGTRHCPDVSGMSDGRVALGTPASVASVAGAAVA